MRLSICAMLSLVTLASHAQLVSISGAGGAIDPQIGPVLFQRWKRRCCQHADRSVPPVCRLQIQWGSKPTTPTRLVTGYGRQRWGNRATLHRCRQWVREPVDRLIRTEVAIAPRSRVGKPGNGNSSCNLSKKTIQKNYPKKLSKKTIQKNYPKKLSRKTSHKN